MSGLFGIDYRTTKGRAPGVKEADIHMVLVGTFVVQLPNAFNQKCSLTFVVFFVKFSNIQFDDKR